MDTNVTALTVQNRAAIALGAAEHETKLRELAAKHVALVAITNPAGYQDAQSARMELKNTRVDLTHKAKAAREDANAFSAAVLVEERRLIAIIQPEETRLEELQQAWDDKIEAERLAKEQAEAVRVAALQAKVAAIHELLLTVTGKPSTVIADQLAVVDRMVILEADYAEFTNDAKNVRQVTINSLSKMVDQARANEAEQARIIAERAELEKLRKEKAERDAQDAARLKLEQEAAAKKQAEEAEAKRKADLAAAPVADMQVLAHAATSATSATPAVAPYVSGSLPTASAPPAVRAKDPDEIINSVVKMMRGMTNAEQMVVLNAAIAVETKRPGKRVA